jgi:hypothetical protein
MPLCNLPSGCKAQALRNGDGRCWFHSELPEVITARAQGRSRGGSTKRTRVPRTLSDLRDVLSQALARATSDPDKPPDLRVVSRLGQTLTRLYELTELEDKLKRLEANE